MGMTIDEAILDLTALKICGVVPFTKGTIGGGNYKVITEECLNMAINTMLNYQKIKEIVSNNELEWGNASVRANALLEIKKVVEDGNVECGDNEINR